MKNNEPLRKMQAAHRLLTEELPTRQKFEEVRTLISGADPRIDTLLAEIASGWQQAESLSQGEVTELSLKALPEKTEKQKKRKKALLLLWKNLRQLEGEVKRVEQELQLAQQAGSPTESAFSAARILAKAKGPVGVTTLAAVGIVGVMALLGPKEPRRAEPMDAVLGIEFQGKQIPLSELTTSVGPHCNQAEHYHAKNANQATALDGTVIPDPGECGFGATATVEVKEFTR